jgi:hypothetical protein
MHDPRDVNTRAGAGEIVECPSQGIADLVGLIEPGFVEHGGRVDGRRCLS